VIVDNAAGAAEAVFRLGALGHRRIGALGTNDQLWTLQQRHDGYRHALIELGLSYDPDVVSFECAGADAAERFVRHTLAFADPPTAFFSAQHVPSRGIVRAIQSSRHPIDIAMFDEVVDTDLLSTRPHVVVASGPHRLGHIGATLAIEQLDASAGVTREARTVVLAPMIIEHDDVYRAPTLSASLAELAAYDGGRLSSVGAER
jgi:LacI family transcriptional regulator